MATPTRNPEPAPTVYPKYVGATTCDLVPEWDAGLAADAGVLALLRACHAADPDDLTPQLVLADRLDDLGDPRAAAVRAGCELWRAAADTGPAAEPWNYAIARDTLAGVTGTVPGWRLTSAWGCLVAWHCPTGDGSNPMGRTWADERVRVVSRCCWWWSLGLMRNQADAAWSQAAAAHVEAWRFAAALWPLCRAKLLEFQAAFGG